MNKAPTQLCEVISCYAHRLQGAHLDTCEIKEHLKFKSCFFKVSTLPFLAVPQLVAGEELKLPLGFLLLKLWCIIQCFCSLSVTTRHLSDIKVCVRNTPGVQLAR